MKSDLNQAVHSFFPADRDNIKIFLYLWILLCEDMRSEPT